MQVSQSQRRRRSSEAENIFWPIGTRCQCTRG